MIDTEKIEAAVRMILEGIGEDPEREGLKDTPPGCPHVQRDLLRFA